MGGNSSSAKSTTEITTNVMTNVSSSVSSACGASSTSNQSISQVAGGNALMENVSQATDSKINLSCDLTSTMQNDFATQMSQQLQSELTAKLSGVGVKNDTSTETDVKSVTNAVTNISLSDVKSCLANSATTQKITQVAGGNAVMRGISQAAVASVINKCITDNKSVNKAIADFDQKYSNKGTSENAGFDPLGPLTALMQGLGMAAVAPYIASFCIILLCMVCCYCLMSAGGGSSAAPAPAVSAPAYEASPDELVGGGWLPDY